MYFVLFTYRSSKLQNVDPFRDQKRDALTSSMAACASLADYLQQCVREGSGTDVDVNVIKAVTEFIQVRVYFHVQDQHVQLFIQK